MAFIIPFLAEIGAAVGIGEVGAVAVGASEAAAGIASTIGIDSVAAGSSLLSTSTALSAAGALLQGESQAQSAEYNAAIAKQNATIAQQQGVAAAQAQQRDAARKIGAMVANYGASGVQSDSGSPLDVLADSAAMATLDNLTIKYNYALRSAGFESQATLGNMQAQSARTSALFNAGSSLAKGYGSTIPFGGNAIPGLGSNSGVLPGGVGSGTSPY